MDKRRLIFFSIFGAFHLISLIFTIVIDSNDATILLSMVNYVGLFKYLAFLGLVMVTTEFIWAWQDSKNARKTKDDMTLENNTLKAKVYDMQESGKMKPEMQRPAAK
jgi:uncharacterized protein YjfI (DUF2170 family)